MWEFLYIVLFPQSPLQFSLSIIFLTMTHILTDVKFPWPGIVGHPGRNLGSAPSSATAWHQAPH